MGSIPVQRTMIPHAMKPLNSQAITTKPAQPKLKKIKIQLLVHIPHWGSLAKCDPMTAAKKKKKHFLDSFH